jgi:hypothetical protein
MVVSFTFIQVIAQAAIVDQRVAGIVLLLSNIGKMV